MTALALTAKSDLERILALPQREVINCSRQEGMVWAPPTQTLVSAVTRRYARPSRLSCGCQPRYLRALPNGRLLIFRATHPQMPPLPPVETTVEEFLRDEYAITASKNAPAYQAAYNLRQGGTANIEGLGRWFCITELNPVQSWILDELPQTNGILGMIGVGGGKSIAGILSPLAVPQFNQVVILAKPDQRLHYRNAYLQLREHFRVPTIVFDKPEFRFDGTFVDGSPVLHFLPYSLLSSTKSTNLLEAIKPSMIIADEVHLLSNKKSSRTMRFLRYMHDHDGTAFCGWSGSVIKKTIRDVAHLSLHSLGYGSPYPIRDHHVDEWAAVVDPSPVPDIYSDTAKSLRMSFVGRDFDSLKSLGAQIFCGKSDMDAIREAHRDLVVRTPGVISTQSSSATSSITIKTRVVEEIPEGVKAALAGVRQDSKRPDGEELVEALEIASCARGVGAGYYFLWVYPNATEEDKRPGGLIDQWFEARKAWNKELRVKIENGEPFLDSMRLCMNAAERAWQVPRYAGTLPVWPAASWPAWAAIKDKVSPYPKVRWVDDYLAKDAAAWANEHLTNKKRKPGIVWVQASEFGRRIAQIAGINYHEGGADAEAKILAEDGTRSLVASMRAHGESRDGLQFKFSEQLLAELPSSGDRYEQLLGRLARPGQTEDEITTWIYRHTQEYRDAFAKGLMYAEFDQQMTPNSQLLLAADRDFE